MTGVFAPLQEGAKKYDYRICVKAGNVVEVAAIKLKTKLEAGDDPVFSFMTLGH